MISTILVVCIVIIFFKISSLQQSLKELKRELADQKFVPKVVVSEHYQKMDVASAVPISQDNLYPNEKPLSHATDDSFDVTGWIKENFILKIGVLMILAGFGWFVSYAFSNNWIGPVGRIVLGFVSGALITLFGTYRSSKSVVQGNTFSILGSSLVIITALAGQHVYNFFSPIAILSIIFIVCGYIAFFAVVTSNQKLALYGILASLIAPYFSGTILVGTVSFYAYLLIISLASIWVAGFKKWREPIVIGITGVLLYSLQAYDAGMGLSAQKYSILFVVYAISLSYLCVSIWSLIQNKIKASNMDIYLAIANTSILLIFTTRIIAPEYQSLVIACWMLIYAFSGFFVFMKTKNVLLFYVHALVSIALLATATSIELSGQTLVIALAIETAIISIASYLVTGKMKTAETLGLLTFVPFLMSVSSLISSKWDTGIFHSDFFVLVIMALVYMALGALYQTRNSDHESYFKPAHISFILASFYLYALVWLSLQSVFLNRDSAVFIALLIYTIIGLSTHFIGLFKHNKVLKNYGITLLTFVVIRLITIDVWNMDISLRVTTFIVLGALFVSTAFISKRQSALNNPPQI